jgi:splicing factor 3B subunit 1
MMQMNPPAKNLLPCMTPILRNRHEKVQEASINLMGRIGEYFQFDNCNVCLKK